MIRFCTNLYTDEELVYVKDIVIKNIKENILQENVFVITLPSNENNLFDIMNVNELQLEYYKKRSQYIVGIANSRQSAISLVANIIEKFYNKNKDISRKVILDELIFE